jgi:hypothetical protein
MLEISPIAHEIFRTYFQPKQPRNHDTLQVSSVVYLAFTPRSRHVLHSVRRARARVCVCVGRGSLPDDLDLERRHKNWGKDAVLK